MYINIAANVEFFPEGKLYHVNINVFSTRHKRGNKIIKIYIVLSHILLSGFDPALWEAMGKSSRIFDVSSKRGYQAHLSKTDPSVAATTLTLDFRICSRS